MCSRSPGKEGRGRGRRGREGGVGVMYVVSGGWSWIGSEGGQRSGGEGAEYVRVWSVCEGGSGWAGVWHSRRREGQCTCGEGPGRV